MRRGLIVSFIALPVILIVAGALLVGFGPQGLQPTTPTAPEQKPLAPLPEGEADLSPVPNYKGEGVSAGYDGKWIRPTPQFMVGAADQSVPPKTAPEPAANCSPEAIVYYAEQAPDVFDIEKSGLLYGVKTHTADTRVNDMPGYNSCALVVHAILRRAGCTWAKWTQDAKAIYDMAYEHGWRPSDTQEGGCIVAWNSQEPGSRARIGRGKDAAGEKSRGVLYRHVGIATGSWWSMDNTSFLSRPSAGITYRPFRYDSPIFLCPPKPDPKPETAPEEAPTAE